MNNSKWEIWHKDFAAMSMKTRAVSRCWEATVAPHDTGRLRPVCFFIQGPLIPFVETTHCKNMRKCKHVAGISLATSRFVTRHISWPILDKSKNGVLFWAVWKINIICPTIYNKQLFTDPEKIVSLRQTRYTEIHKDRKQTPAGVVVNYLSVFFVVT